MRGWIAVVLTAGCGRFGFDSRDALGDDDAQLGGVFLVQAKVNNTCAIVDGALSCWGSNARGQLLTGDQVDQFAPTPIGTDTDWIAVAPGQDHICGVRAGGDVYCWGSNDRGQLGVGDFTERLVPTRVDLARPVIAIDAYYHTCAVLDNAELWCWGDNGEGQLGQNDSGSAPDIPLPVQVTRDRPWSHVATGQGHTLAISGGVVYGTGRNTNGELGQGPTAPAQLRELTMIDTGYTSIAAGQNNSCGIRSDASAACWGDNTFYQLATGDQMVRTSPTTIATSQRDVDINTFHACTLASANTISCAGRNIEGQLGTGDRTQRTTLTPSGTFDDWIQLSIGRFHTCGMRSDRSVWCVGQNTMGQIGVTGPQEIVDWTRVF